jgi:hypothetical protein
VKICAAGRMVNRLAPDRSHWLARRALGRLELLEQQ